MNIPARADHDAYLRPHRWIPPGDDPAFYSAEGSVHQRKCVDLRRAQVQQPRASEDRLRRFDGRIALRPEADL
ncbi:hypothetical protein BDW22DRAFT_1364532 [Trametopsis cervina]|nr:hypothetical protein BDW22DRAFT_1364532 [Trametopsis cervina]